MKEVIIQPDTTVPQVVKMLFPEAEGLVHQGVQFDFVRRWSPLTPVMSILGVEMRLRRYVVGRKIFRRVMLKQGKLDLDQLQAKFDELVAIDAPLAAKVQERETEVERLSAIRDRLIKYAEALGLKYRDVGIDVWANKPAELYRLDFNLQSEAEASLLLQALAVYKKEHPVKEAQG